MKQAFRNNWKLYLMEAAGLAIFMTAACFVGGLLWSPHSIVDHWIKTNEMKNIVMGVSMGLTAAFIFYSPVTAPSGAQINPAVTITFLRLGRIKRQDAIFYILFQFIGGTLAVYVMSYFMGRLLTDPGVNYVVTVPVKGGSLMALMVEIGIAFITMTMILFTSSQPSLSKYTRVFAACLVCTWVIFAGPVSGFGMNPARSFSSALPANTWTSFWIYLTAPLIGMLSAAEVFLLVKKNSLNHFQCFHIRQHHSALQLSKINQS